MKGYKATMPDGRSWYSPDTPPYVAGETYSYDGPLELCSHGLHFCKRMEDVYVTYLESYQTRVFEVTALGKCLDNGVKYCTDKLRIDRELSPMEILGALVVHSPVRYGHDALFDIIRQTVYGVNNPIYASYNVDYDLAMNARMTERKQLFVNAAMAMVDADKRLSALLEEVKAAIARERGERQ